jgi:hypothetical protein
MTERPVEGAPRPPFDPIFAKLVKEADESDEEKLIGFIAFGLYQQAKREWLSEFRDRQGRYPGDEEIRAYELSWTASRQEALRSSAVQLVAAYADSVVNQTEREILRSAVRGRFWRGVAVWLFSALLFTILLIGLLVGLSRSGIDPIATLESMSLINLGNRPEAQPGR